MAEATGGRVFFPFQISDVANFFMEIENELRSQYALAYKPTDFSHDGRYRKVSIVAQNKEDLRVHARPGLLRSSRLMASSPIQFAEVQDPTHK